MTTTSAKARDAEPVAITLSPEGERLLRVVLDHASDAVIVQDLATGLVVDVNARTEALYGYDRDEFRAFPPGWDLRTPEERATGASLYALHERGEPLPNRPRWHRRKDGTLVPVEATVTRLEVDGRALLVASLRDVSRRHRVEHLYRFLAGASHELASSLDADRTLARIAELAVPEIGDWCAVFVRDERGRYRRVAITCAASEPAALREELERHFPAEPADPATLPVRLRFQDSLLVERVDEAFLRSVTGEGGDPEVLGRLGLVSLLAVGMRAGGRPFGLIVLGTAGSGRRFGPADRALAEELAGRAALAVENARLYQELEERKGQLQEFVGRLLVSQEEERRKVAYELHEGLAQVAAAAHQHLEAYVSRRPAGDTDNRGELEQALALTRRTVREARRLVDGLRPTVLDDLGLVTALRHEVEGLRDEGLRVDYRQNLGAERLPAPVETTLFRVAQEAIANARRHVGANRLAVSLERVGGDHICLEVRDWGRGFDPADPPACAGGEEHLGLTGMQERLTLLGGRLRVRRRPGGGTRVLAEIPLDPT